MLAEMRAAFGYDKPLPVQYFLWLGSTLTGDMGYSLRTGAPVFPTLIAAARNTILIGVGAAFLGFIFGVTKRSSRGLQPRHLDRQGGVFRCDLPVFPCRTTGSRSFWLSFSRSPSDGSPRSVSGSGESFWSWAAWRHMVLPVVALAAIPGAIIARTARAAVMEILNMEFVEALRARGLSERRILWHVARNALPTVLAVMGLQFAHLLGGSILVETVFTWPGTGVPAQSGDIRSRCAGASGHDHAARAFLCAHQPCRRYPSGVGRSPDQPLMKTLDDPAITQSFDVASAEPPLDVPDSAPAVQRTYWQNVCARVARDPYTMLCIAVLILMSSAAIFAPWLGLDDPNAANSANRLLPPGSPGHVLGTDELGRDMLTRLVYGGRLSLAMGVLPVVVAASGRRHAGIDRGFRRRAHQHAHHARHRCLLCVSLDSPLPWRLQARWAPGSSTRVVAIIIVFIPSITRITESVTTQVRSMDFVEAARASGATDYAIIRTHILGNILGPVLVYATVLVSVSILVAAGPLVYRSRRELPGRRMGAHAQHAARIHISRAI